MKIAYIATIRLPTEKAHGYAILRTCLAWRSLGHEVTLYYPDRTKASKEEIFAFYGLPADIELISVPAGDWIARAGFLGSLAFIFQMLVFLLKMPRLDKDGTVIFSRDTFIAGLYGLLGHRAFWNAHTWNGSLVARILFPRLKGIVCISENLQRVVAVHASVPSIVSRSGTDANPYVGFDISDLRKELGLPIGSTIAMYTGHLYAWKGADVIVAAARLTPDIAFVFVGGTASDVESFRGRTSDVSNVILTGHKSKDLIPKYLVSADVLILPNLATEDISSLYTSPLKLIEYMASGVPIVASDLPSIREIVDDTSAYLKKAGDPEALSLGIREALTSDSSSEKAQRALTASRSLSWESQARISAEFMQAQI